MKQNVSRRFFFRNAFGLAGTMMVPWASGNPVSETAGQDKLPPINSELVKEFVRSSHGNFERVKQLLDEHPNLLNAAWDWGNGDFETGLNAAGHVGNVVIAEYLLSRGARMDIFCAAMLGKLEIVKPLLEAYPNLKLSKGPHGLALIHHATKGGDNARATLDYLKEIGAS